MKKKLAIALAALTCFSLTACGTKGGSSNGGEVIDPDDTRKQLIVGVYDGAVGKEWATVLEKEYEALHTDVNVVIRSKKGDYDDQSLLSRIARNDEDIYYLSVNNINSFIEKGLVANLTKVVTDKVFNDSGDLVESGATKSIEDTMWDIWKGFNKTSDGEYYSIPNFTPAAGITYDADLFTEKGWQVPETYDELKTLLDTIAADGITPFTVGNEMYIWYTAIAFWANYEGANNFMLNSTFSGTDSNLGEITPDNAYELAKQEGRKAYLQFYYDLARENKYTTDGTRGTQSNVQSQQSFINGVLNGYRVAMIMENSFWERESYSDFETAGMLNEDYGWGKRNFKYMIAPVNKETDRKTVYLTYPNSHVVVSENSDQKELAFDFLQFAQQRSSLATYVINTGCLRPYDFTMTAEEKAKATPYTQSIIELLERDDVDFVTMGPGEKAKVKDATNTPYLQNWANSSSLKDITTQSNPFQAFRGYGSLSVDSYFNGMYTFVKKHYWNK